MWPYPRTLAHRGGGILAPENTLAALRCGLAYGYHAVEFDVMLASDGMPVVVHDPELGRTVAGSGHISDYTAAQLGAMEAGAWFGAAFAGEGVPTFEAVVAYCKAQRIWMNIEIKPAPGFDVPTGEAVARATRGYFAQEIAAGELLPLLSSFSIEALQAARQAAPELARGWLVEQIPDGWERQARELGVVALHCDHQQLTPALAVAVKQEGLGLFCYTVNTPERASELLAWGVDGFCTDRIDLIKA
ncbi:glycerophosphodiester phosphodiesterase [Janthinobacterium lividum]|uniref:glycerophosphodiester phosphodiesterase n=1 Tax=Janthinobacterium lividum TaxID=29581 RepID=UPI000873F449|nr:glycerophosphodiester phosphodiesterase [Janthinobacterium lividum]MCC7714587.1 glycerophosphodiester phosphodiesterase [Janthinobacterium lividum]OEZ55212.1 glycerophosphoryl diester phosphodiesterase [Janthinobacterium lividum]WQE30212.1 glycerophosphodiester phosphodiesterase [Janthinobacterium lividum]STQ95710.1 Glycerophosphoryl diester phosphodiesterase [Janthinobacterium lividum]